MLYWFAIIIIAPLMIGVQLLLVMLAVTGVAWWTLIAVAIGLLAILFRIFFTTLKPNFIGISAFAILALSAVVGTYTLVVLMMADGLAEAGKIEREMRALVDRSRTIEIADENGRPIGILPAALDPARSDSPYLSIHVAASDVPPVFKQCIVFLEDRDIGQPWHINGIDFRRLALAVGGKFLLLRGGGSGLAEQLDRSLRNSLPKPKSGFFSEFGRKLVSWRDLPVVTRLYPDESSLVAAAASHLPLMVGARNSRWGGEVRGIALAAIALGKSIDTLNASEQALLAAAVNMPLRIGVVSGALSEGVLKSWNKAKERADYCLRNADFDGRINREEVRNELKAIAPPSTVTRHPEIVTRDRLGGRVPAIVRELQEDAGADWSLRVAGVVLRAQSSSGIDVGSFRKVVEQVQQQHSFTIPLWAGENAAIIFGSVVDEEGNVLSTVANTEYDASRIKFPIGSLGKIPAALTLGSKGSPTAATRSAFARSDSKAILRRMSRVPEDEIVRAFEALGWPLSPGQSPRRNAAYGAVEISPAAVLAAIIGLNDLLTADRDRPVVLPGLVRDVTFVDGTRLKVNPNSELPIEPLRTLVTPTVRSYVKTVLGGPLMPGGTMRTVGAMLRDAGAASIWGKSGTADAQSGGFGVAPTRALWHAGGFSLGGRRLSFVMVIASRDGRRSLGFVQSPSIAPLTIALLRHAIKHFNSTVADSAGVKIP